MGKKVSDMNLATEVGENDLLMIVQNGINKKIPATTFQLAGEAIESAETLNGYSDEDFVKVGDAASNAEKLGGVDADQYATKNYVDTRGGTVYADPTWCCPKMWFSTSVLPNNDNEHWHFCDGANLDPEAYPELFAVIGYEYTRDTYGNKATSGNFCLPNLNGKFVLGANLSGTRKTTTNLPTDLLHNNNGDFTEHGQWIYPEEAGKSGGDPTTVQLVKEQLATHRHTYTKPVIASQGEAHSSAEYRVQGTETTANTGYEGDNNGSLLEPTDVTYPYQQLATVDGNGNVSGIQGMLSVPPYLTFAWIMRIKP